MHKKTLVSLILTQLNQELESLMLSAKTAHEAATHEESKPEDSHDTRGLEASYLAGAQMARIEILKNTIASLQYESIRDFKSTDPIGMGALLELQTGDKRVFYFLTGQGGGVSINFEGKTVQVITAKAPLGEALVGQHQGDVIEVESPRGNREYTIIGLT